MCTTDQVSHEITQEMVRTLLWFWISFFLSHGLSQSSHCDNHYYRKMYCERSKKGMSDSENKDHGIWSHHFWQIDWEAMETVTDFFFLVSKITADGKAETPILWPPDA